MMCMHNIIIVENNFLKTVLFCSNLQTNVYALAFLCIGHYAPDHNYTEQRNIDLLNQTYIFWIEGTF